MRIIFLVNLLFLLFYVLTLNPLFLLYVIVMGIVTLTLIDRDDHGI